MSATYSSAFLDKQVNSINDLIRLVSPYKVKLVLDTNICISLREFYQRPNMLPKDTWEFLKQFIYDVHINNMLIDYSLGCEEACRSSSNFQINEAKLNQMVKHLNLVFEMSYEQLLSYRHSEIDISPIKDETQKPNTKIGAINEPSSFQNIMLINYVGLLKAFLIHKYDYDDNMSKLLRYYDFLDREVDVVGHSSLMFGIYFFGGDSSVRKLLIKKYNNIAQLLHNILNAAIDLTFLTLVTNRYVVNEYIPVFATRDIGLGVMFKTMKLRFAITDEHQLKNLPQIVQGNYPTHVWSDAEIKKIDDYIKTLSMSRIYKSIGVDDAQKIKVLHNLKVISIELENEIKRRIIN
jgi:hypothetical protein